MRILAFEVRSERGIRLAKCEKVPPLMIVAGPNGCGKSTLLNALRSQGGYQNVMYVGPHRAMRRQQVQQRHLLTSPISLELLLASPSVPGFEGIRILDGTRDPWGYDDSASYLKHALCQIETDRQQAITDRVDRNGGIEPGTLVDLWKPLRELTTNLLPHLEFVKIDSSNRDQVRALWRVHSQDTLVDIDDLSSGEKSIVQMFYPLLERDIRGLLTEIKSGPQEITRPDTCVLIDEPELHLHPNLQVKVLDYLRLLASAERRTQVIIATHSPTIVEYASFEELYLLRPVELVEPEANQLVRVANDEERLAFLRDVFGTTANLTAMQPLVIVEGIRERDATKAMPDRKLYRALHPQFDSVTLIAGGGKGECKALLRVLNEALGSFSHQLRAIALLDRNGEGEGQYGSVKLLPVAMIENFLLDPDSLWEAIQSVVERTGLCTVDDVAEAMDRLLDEVENDEIGHRVARILGSVHFHPPSKVDDVAAQASEFVEEVERRYSPQAIESAKTAAGKQVEYIRKGNRRREEYHGKSILHLFYKRHLAQTGLAKVVFTFETARHARRRKAVVKFFDEFFELLALGNAERAIRDASGAT